MRDKTENTVLGKLADFRLGMTGIMSNLMNQSDKAKE